MTDVFIILGGVLGVIWLVQVVTATEELFCDGFDSVQDYFVWWVPILPAVVVLVRKLKEVGWKP